ncbi:TolC family protein [Marinobacter arenosus]|uniref:TolC family protein n=1 Tax=Marinobacter arenosus TaxID=2856822 RepID=UPI001C4D4828|nr:TolC family protein [Marinobacter arenosus]MBW0146193.1 TolC family protein [Marinobacter arenosus]
MRNTRLWAGLVSLLVLAGCASAPNYDAKVAHTQDYLAGLRFEASSTTNEQTRWWETLNDAQLNRLVEQAHLVNLDLQATDRRLQEALAQLGVSESERLPQGGGVGEYSVTDRDDERLESARAGAQITWELDLFGRIRSVIDAREAGVASAEALDRAALKEVTVGVIQAYLRWESSRQQVALIESDLEALDASLKLVRNRVEAGLSPRLDLARAETLYHQQRVLLPVARNNQFRTRASLAVLLGQDPDDLSLTAAPATLKQARALPVGDEPGLALQSRADIAAALASLAQAAALSEAAVSDLYPQVTVEGFAGFSNIEGVGDGFEDTLSAIPRISWAVLSYPALLKQVEVQEARTEAQYVAYRKTVVEAVGQARVVADRFSRTEQSERASARALEASRVAFNTSESLYREGAIGYLDYLDANREWIAAQRAHLNAQFDLADSRLGLLRAFSGLWSHSLYRQIRETGA